MPRSSKKAFVQDVVDAVLSLLSDGQDVMYLRDDIAGKLVNASPGSSLLFTVAEQVRDAWQDVRDVLQETHGILVFPVSKQGAKMLNNSDALALDTRAALPWGRGKHMVAIAKLNSDAGAKRIWKEYQIQCMKSGLGKAAAGGNRIAIAVQNGHLNGPGAKAMLNQSRVQFPERVREVLANIENVRLLPPTN